MKVTTKGQDMNKVEYAKAKAASSRAMLDSQARVEQLMRDLSDELRTLTTLYEQDGQPAYEVGKIEFLRKMLWTAYTGHPNLLSERGRWQSAHREREQHFIRLLSQS